jgi:predicted membrane-bound spermidine synthase
LAAHRDPRRVLVGLLALAAALAAATPWTSGALTAILETSRTGFRARVALGIAAGYGAAFVAIGALSPVVARMALAGAASTGRRVGLVSAAGTLGALVGSLATGPLLLPRFRLEGTALGIAASLALVAAGTSRRRAMPAALAAACALLALLAAAPWAPARAAGLALALRPDADGVWVADGGYARVVIDRAPEAERYARDVRRMKIDLRTHGIHDVADPSWIGSNYATLYAAATERIAKDLAAPRVLFLGGGTYTAPRWISSWRPEAVVDVAEIDPEVTRGAREVLGLVESPRLRALHDDARAVVRDAAAGTGPRYDLVYMDAFGDLGVPWHLTTREFLRDVKRAMTPEGVYFANSIDVFSSGRFVAAIWATLAESFRHVAVVGVRRGDDWVQNFVFVASDAPFDLEALRRRNPAAWAEGDTLAVVRYPDEEFDALVARTGSRPLTDDFAPVEDMLSPAVELTSRP